jgi:hypothetical protein
MTEEKKPSFSDAIKAAMELKRKLSPETSAKIHQAKNTPKAIKVTQVTTNKPTTKTTGRGK